jgi:hypothetical protein
MHRIAIVVVSCTVFASCSTKDSVPKPIVRVGETVPISQEFHLGTPEECAAPGPIQTEEQAAGFDREYAKQEAEFQATGSYPPDTSVGGFLCDDNRMKPSSGENFPDLARPICIEGANPAGVTEVPVSGNTERMTDCRGRILSLEQFERAVSVGDDLLLNARSGLTTTTIAVSQ